MTNQDKFTIAEASFITGQPVTRIHRLFDAGPLRARAKKRHIVIRMLEPGDVLFVLATSEEPLSHLDPTGKSKVYQCITRTWNDCAEASRRSWPKRIQLSESVDLNWKRLSGCFLQGEKDLQRAKDSVSTDPEIRGGEAVISGTRIPVQVVHELLAGGMSGEEILQHYPTLTAEKIRLADIYARAYPRRGRPTRHPWHARSS